MIGGIFTSVYFSLIIYSRDWLDNKIGLFYDEFIGLSYQGVILWLVAISISLSWGFFGIAFVKTHNIYVSLIRGVVVYFPPIFMLLRLNVYRNENSRRLLVEDECGNKSYQQVIGYHPVPYFLIGLMLCKGPLSVSLSNVVKSLIFNAGDLYYNLYCFSLSLMLGCFILSPDIANKILPFELKTLDGLKKFLIMSFALIMGVFLLMVQF
ncbi:MAG: hypothetical protein IJF83_09090 [Methanobrevibacter sp.]|nr:hypothetical protein [Methanobrevibacter sp.]